LERLPREGLLLDIHHHAVLSEIKMRDCKQVADQVRERAVLTDAFQGRPGLKAGMGSRNANRNKEGED
jgi:hypothetical protein